MAIAALAGVLVCVGRWFRRSGRAAAADNVYRDIFESAADGIWFIDAAGRTVMVNQKVTQLLGYPSQNMLGRSPSEFVAESSRASFLSETNEVRNGFRHSCEKWFIRRNGTRIFLRVSSGPIFRGNGTYAGMVFTLTELTDRKQMEEELRKNEERFALAARASRDIIWDFDIVHDRLWFSDRFWEDFGYDPVTFPSGVSGWAELIHPDDQAVIEPVDDTYRTLEYRLRRKDGSWAYVRDRSYLVRDVAGRPIRRVGTIADVTREKESELALAASEERYRHLFERNMAGVFRSRPDGRLLDCNDALCRMLGYESREELYNLDLTESYVDPDERTRGLQLLLEQGQLVGFEARLRQKDGRIIHVLANLSVWPDAGAGGPVVQGTVVEITELRELQTQLMQARKMEAIGKLAGGVAHDFNNILMVISSYSELLSGTVQEPRQKRHVEQIQKACWRAADLTMQLLAFSRQQVIAPKITDINAVIRDMASMVSRLLGEDVRLRLALSGEVDMCSVDPNLIQQVIMKLAANARDSMPEGGTLAIVTQNTEVDDVLSATQPPMVPGRYVLITISDTGAGMDAATQARIFEPFFTSKELGKGTGLGLSTVYGIVKQHQGYIFVESETGRGTTFRVYLPPAEGRAPATEVEARVAAPITRTSVLLVEDEEALREATAAFLRERGCTVIAAGDGEEALQLAADDALAIDVLVTDVVMPGMSGPAVARHIVGKRPEVRVIYMSGYSENKALVFDAVPGVHLQKPFSLLKLSETLCDILRLEPDLLES